MNAAEQRRATVAEKRRAAIADHAAKLVAEAPPLSADQRDRLAAILRPAAVPSRGEAAS